MASFTASWRSSMRYSSFSLANHLSNGSGEEFHETDNNNNNNTNVNKSRRSVSLQQQSIAHNTDRKSVSLGQLRLVQTTEGNNSNNGGNQRGSRSYARKSYTFRLCKPSNITHQSGFFPVTDSKSKEKNLFWQAWLPDIDKIRAIVILLHDIHGHSGHFENLVHSFNKENYGVFAFDYQGHGRSDGKPGYIDKFDRWMEQALLFFDIVTNRVVEGDGDGSGGESPPYLLTRKGLPSQYQQQQQDASSDKKRVVKSSKKMRRMSFYERNTTNKHMSIFAEAVKHLPVFLFGQGIGGSFALHIAQERYEKPNSNLLGVILSAPTIELPRDIFGVMQRFAKGLGRLTPHAHVIDMNIEKMCHSPKEVERYKTDTLCHNFKMRARVGCELIQYTTKMKEDHNLQCVTVPFLLLQGTDDHHASYNGAKRLYELASSFDKNMRTFEGFWHDLLHELCAESLITEICNWLDERAPSIEANQDIADLAIHIKRTNSRTESFQPQAMI